MVIPCAVLAVVAPHGMDDDRLRWHLDNWAYWQRNRASDYGRGAPPQAAGGFVSGNSSDFEDMVARVDQRCANAVDAIVHKLDPVERCSVYHFHMAAVFRFPRLDKGLAYRKARVAIRAGLLRRGID